jgi:ankyrin repeat protein
MDETQQKKKPSLREKFAASLAVKKKKAKKVARRLHDLFDQYATAEGRQGRKILEALSKQGGTQQEVLDILAQIPAGAPVNLEVRDEHGETPLQRAILKGWTDVALALLDRNADPNSKEYALGMTPLMQVEDEGLARALIKKGARIDERDNTGATALIWAATFGRTDIVRVLLENGADPAAKDDSGHDAVFFAQQRHHGEIKKMLAKAVEARQAKPVALQP